MMENERNADGARFFAPHELLSHTQIQGFFSRLKNKMINIEDKHRIEVKIDDECNDEPMNEFVSDASIPVEPSTSNDADDDDCEIDVDTEVP